jgi:hypothetical protein
MQWKRLFSVALAGLLAANIIFFGTLFGQFFISSPYFLEAAGTPATICDQLIGIGLILGSSTLGGALPLWWLKRRTGCGYQFALACLSHALLIPLVYQLPVSVSLDEVVFALAPGIVLAAAIRVNLTLVGAKLSKQHWRTMFVVNLLLIAAVLMPYGRMTTILLAWVVMPVTALLTTADTNSVHNS